MRFVDIVYLDAAVFAYGSAGVLSGHHVGKQLPVIHFKNNNGTIALAAAVLKRGEMHCRTIIHNSAVMAEIPLPKK